MQFYIIYISLLIQTPPAKLQDTPLNHTPQQFLRRCLEVENYTYIHIDIYIHIHIITLYTHVYIFSPNIPGEGVAACALRCCDSVFVGASVALEMGPLQPGGPPWVLTNRVVKVGGILVPTRPKVCGILCEVYQLKPVDFVFVSCQLWSQLYLKTFCPKMPGNCSATELSQR